MRLPLEVVFKRGAIFLWRAYAKLDDPALAGQTKPKFIVVISSSHNDDPILYILTTSEKTKHTHHPVPGDLLHIKSGSYGFFALDTLIDSGEAGELEIDRAAFAALYDSEAVLYRGCLNDQDVAELMRKIGESRRVARRVKQILVP
jgi:hypothetical protein